MYGLAADLIVIAHLAFIVFVMFGAALALRWRWMPWVHLPAMAWGAATEFFHLICPLTPLENDLRRRAGGDGYSGDFISHYVEPIIYPESLTSGTQWLLGIGLVVLNAALYYVVWRRRSHAPG